MSTALSRMMTIDSAVVGLSRRELIAQDGAHRTARLVVKLGFVQGWRAGAGVTGERRVAARLVDTVAWLQRLGVAHAGRSEYDDGARQGTLSLDESSEALAQLDHMASGDGGCWFAAGLMSGYLSRALRQSVVCREMACLATGAPTCRFLVQMLGDIDITADPFLDTTCGDVLRHLDLLDRQTIEVAAASDVEATTTMRGIRSARMRALVADATQAAQVGSTILITGESGVGKERLAQLIHERSPRKTRRFLAINCGAVSDGLLESALFGHCRGAFTGAANDREGLFEAAKGGTVFLDEIGETSPHFQTRLLRVLQERNVQRVGEMVSRPIDVRIIAATNRDLEGEVDRGRFRQDLYFRLAVVPLTIPPLRDRPEDVRALVDHFVLSCARRLERPVTGYTDALLDRLLGYAWPGNVRELENVIERAVALSGARVLDVDDLPQHIRRAVARMPAVDRMDPIRPLAEMELTWIREALRRSGGSRTAAARALGISRATLYRRLHVLERSVGTSARHDRNEPG